jgi:8-oxo-dGTP pyrophosphatase MutT (NUDIX family)
MTSSERLPVRTSLSAGGVVYRRRDISVDVVLCGRTTESLWVLPKGTPEDGERLEQTAEREVAEETGLTVRLGQKVGVIEYWFTARGARWHKYVHHWLMEPTGGGLHLHDHEFDAAEWLPAEQALSRLTYDDERRILREAMRRIGPGA